MSGVTTTGATTLSNLESLPKGILIWRAILQWLGGLGIIVFAIAIIPIFNIGGIANGTYLDNKKIMLAIPIL